MPRRKTVPDHATRLTTYAELDDHVRAFTEGHLSLLIVIGTPGLQKSTVIQQAVEGKAAFFEGNATAFALYLRLYEQRHAPVVIDDVDHLFTDKAGVRLLRSLCQTTPAKTLRWDSDAHTLKAKDIPNAFQTTSNVAIVANEWRTLNQNVAAVEDRAHLVLFAPTPLDVHLRVADWFWDQEIFDFIGRQLHIIEIPSMRDYIKAAEKKQAGLDWKGPLLQRWSEPITRLVARLLDDPSFKTEQERVEAFTAQSGQVRSQYFYHKKRLPPKMVVPHVVLKNRPREAG